MISLFVKPNCPPCKATKRELDKRGIDYQTFDVTEDPAAVERVKSLGYSSAPVVLVNENWHWTGYRPTELAKLSD